MHETCFYRNPHRCLLSTAQHRGEPAPRTVRCGRNVAKGPIYHPPAHGHQLLPQHTGKRLLFYFGQLQAVAVINRVCDNLETGRGDGYGPQRSHPMPGPPQPPASEQEPGADSTLHMARARLALSLLPCAAGCSRGCPTKAQHSPGRRDRAAAAPAQGQLYKKWHFD